MHIFFYQSETIADISIWHNLLDLRQLFLIRHYFPMRFVENVEITLKRDIILPFSYHVSLILYNILNTARLWEYNFEVVS